MRRLRSTEPGFRDKLLALLTREEDAVAGIDGTVREIIARVRKEGDEALVDLSRRFDGSDLSGGLRVSATEIDDAVSGLAPEALEAMEEAALRIEAYHDRQRPEDERWSDAEGNVLGWRWTPLDAVALYVPGGTAAYPSSVLMNAIPAKVAGVERIVILTPARDGAINPLVLAAARRCGIDEIYKIGGAQAVAAAAYGTKSIAPVDKIVGPGNAFVAEAKRQVFGHVGIDSIAGPSEITVIADSTANPQHIAADLLSQSEHDKLSQSLLITPDEALAEAVIGAVDRQLEDHPRAEFAGPAWRDQGGVILCRDLAEAAEIANTVAAEHLELVVADPDALLPSIRHAGAIFLGPYTPEAIGDYVGGPSHVLPTSRAARFSSGLSVLDFVKRSSITGCSRKGFEAIAPAAARLADIEGLPSHAASVRLRMKGSDG